MNEIVTLFKSRAATVTAKQDSAILGYLESRLNFLNDFVVEYRRRTIPSRAYLKEDYVVDPAVKAHFKKAARSFMGFATIAQCSILESANAGFSGVNAYIASLGDDSASNAGTDIGFTTVMSKTNHHYEQAIEVMRSGVKAVQDILAVEVFAAAYLSECQEEKSTTASPRLRA